MGARDEVGLSRDRGYDAVRDGARLARVGDSMSNQQDQSRIRQAQHYRHAFEARPDDVLEDAEWDSLPGFDGDLLGRITCESVGKLEQAWLTDADTDYVIKPGPNQTLWIEVVR